MREIARRLGRAPSTISRELRRNNAAHDVGGYDGDLARSRARERAERPRGGRLLTEQGLRQAVQSKLELEWSPEQIAAWLRLEFADRPLWHVCHETIYQALYNGAKGWPEQATHQEVAHAHRTAASQAAPACPRAEPAVHRPRAAD